MTSLVTSHGADFFGADSHAVRTVVSLADYARHVLAPLDRVEVVQLLEGAGQMEAGAVTAIPAAMVPTLATQLRAIARCRAIRSPRLAATAALLADAAERAAADGDDWTLTLQTAEDQTAALWDGRGLTATTAGPAIAGEEW
ncbi:hypothetical protein ACFC8F_33920 [Streptomyces hydrogenans]|uniref:DUF7739 domain-containing protein n=1 Tax=Streptomyces hydrogenans TaxID=1873719 RepID=UPI0035E3B43F